MVELIPSESNLQPVQNKALDQKAQEEKEFKFFGEDGFSFWDFVDVVNPLQHIPLVSTVYRDLSGDEIDHGARLAGGTLFGGPIGLASSAFNVILDHNTGKDAGEHVMAWFDGDETEGQPTDTQTQFVQNERSIGEPRSYASYASLAPEGEEAAFAAGQASLRMADLYEFMNAQTAEQIPLETETAALTNPIVQSNIAAGSAGTWSPVALSPAHFPSERNVAESLTQKQQEQPAQLSLAEQINKMQSGKTTPPYDGFQANQSHLESVSALQAFARDVKAQQVQQVDTQEVEQQLRPQPITTSQLTQTNSEWFASMMNQNIDRYELQVNEDRFVEDVDP